MKPSFALEEHREDIRRIVQANHGTNPRVFGSVARGEDTDTSDLNILIDAAPGLSLFDMARIALAIERVVATRVGVKTPDDISQRFQHQVVAEAKPI